MHTQQGGTILQDLIQARQVLLPRIHPAICQIHQVLVSHCKNHQKPVFMMLVCLFSIMMLFSFCVKPASILKVYASCWISGSLASIMLPICNFGNFVRNVGYHGRQPKIHQASRSWCFGSVSNSDEESYLSRSTCFGSFHAKKPRINGWELYD